MLGPIARVAGTVLILACLFAQPCLPRTGQSDRGRNGLSYRIEVGTTDLVCDRLKQAYDHALGLAAATATPSWTDFEATAPDAFGTFGIVLPGSWLGDGGPHLLKHSAGAGPALSLVLRDFWRKEQRFTIVDTLKRNVDALPPDDPWWGFPDLTDPSLIDIRLTDVRSVAPAKPHVDHDIAVMRPFDFRGHPYLITDEQAFYRPSLSRAVLAHDERRIFVDRLARHSLALVCVLRLL